MLIFSQRYSHYQISCIILFSLFSVFTVDCPFSFIAMYLALTSIFAIFLLSLLSLFIFLPCTFSTFALLFCQFVSFPSPPCLVLFTLTCSFSRCILFLCYYSLLVGVFLCAFDSVFHFQNGKIEFQFSLRL